MDSHRTKVALLRALAIVGGVIFTAVLFAAVALNMSVDTEAVHAWVAPRASAVMNRPVTVGSVSVAFLPHPSIQVDEVRVDNLSGYEGPALAFVERLRLDVATLPLLIGRVRVRGLTLEEPRINLSVDAGGTSNYGDLAPARSDTPGGPASPVRLALRHITVSNATVSYRDETSSRSFLVSGVDLSAALDRDSETAGWRAEVTSESDSLLVHVPSMTDEILHLAGPAATLTLVGDASDRSVDVTDGSARLEQYALNLHGRIAGLEGPRPSYDLQLTNEELDADVLSVVVPTSRRSELMPRFDGVLRVTFQVTGPPEAGRGPVLRGSVRLDDVAAHLGGNVMVDHVRGTVGVAPDTITADSVSGMFAEGPFRLSGQLSRESREMVLTAYLRPDLDALDRLGLLPQAATVSGNAVVDLALSGRIDALDSLSAAGTVELSGAQAKLGRFGVPLYVPTGVVTFVDREVSWSDLTLLVGEDRTVTTGRFVRSSSSTPSFDVSVQAAHLDLGALLPPRDRAVPVGYPMVAVSHLGGREIQGRAPASILAGWGMSRPERVPATGRLQLDVDTLRFRDRILEGVVARVQVSDTAIAVDAPELGIWGGTGSAELQLGVGAAFEEPFSLTLRATDAAGEQLLGTLMPIGDGISGRMSLEAEIHGATDRSLLPVSRNLAGKVVLTASDGHIRNTGPNFAVADFLQSDEWLDFPFQSWETRIDLEEGRVEVRSSDLEGPLGRVALAGTMRFDGSHDLALGLSIPPEHFDQVSLRRTGIGQGVLDRLRTTDSALDLGLRMRGVIWAPSLEPDASSALASAR